MGRARVIEIKSVTWRSGAEEREKKCMSSRSSRNNWNANVSLCSFLFPSFCFPTHMKRFHVIPYSSRLNYWDYFFPPQSSFLVSISVHGRQLRALSFFFLLRKWNKKKIVELMVLETTDLCTRVHHELFMFPLFLSFLERAWKRRIAPPFPSQYEWCINHRGALEGSYRAPYFLHSTLLYSIYP